MANSYFQFKQFRIDQGPVAMKVTTEGCILGAWVAHKVKNVWRVLDIGAGTGLLSLMLAQKLDEAVIEAVELDEAAAGQATANFGNSPWGNRLKLSNERIQDFYQESKYDLIISNPPFFNQSLTSPTNQINLARHDDSLSQKALLDAVLHYLTEEGSFYVLYPPREAELFQVLAMQHGLHMKDKLIIYTSPTSKVFRVIASYTKKASEMADFTMVIKDGTGQYTADFVSLLKDYYLYL